MALKAQVIDDSVTPNAVVVAEVPSAADMDAKQNRTRNLIILTAISNTRTLDGTEDVIIATGASPTSIFDPGSLPVLFELEVRNDSSVNCVFNPDIGSTISIPPGESVMLRQIAAGSWVNALDGLATLAYLATNGPRTYFPSTTFTAASTSSQAIAGFDGITIKAGQKYTVIIQLRGTCSSTTGGYIGFWANTGTDHIVRLAGRTDSVANAAVFLTLSAGYNSLSANPMFASNLANNFGMLIGTITGGAADATFELRGARVNSANSFTIYADGSSITVIPG